MQLIAGLGPQELRDAPSDSAAFTNGIVPRDALLDVLQSSGSFSQVRFRTEGGNVLQGWIETAKLQPSGPVDPAIDAQVFFEKLEVDARAARSNRDYLYALAFAESGIQNIPTKAKRPDGSPASTAFGPFQILRDTWAEFLNGAGGRLGLTTEDRFRWQQQTVWAAITTARQIERFATEFQRWPLPAELYLLHAFGDTGGGRLLRAALNRGAVGDLLSPSALEGNPGFFPNGSATPLKAVLAEAERRLEAGYAQAATHSPPLSPLPAAAAAAAAAPGDPAYLTTAIAEIGTVEGDPRVLDYLRATDAPVTPQTAWCAAFVSFCMRAAGIPYAPGQSANAGYWQGWGQSRSTSDPRRGAVVLVAGTGISGFHAGFMLDFDNTHFDLLAGNQTPTGGSKDAVCVKRRRRAEILFLRDPP